MHQVSELLAAPPAARIIFGTRLPVAQRYVELLATTGVAHGLIGPRELGRLWDRHVLNCGVLIEALTVPGGRVTWGSDVTPGARLPTTDTGSLIDVGSGAGLPGLVLAILRPQLETHLVEPMQRRATWLATAVDELELDNVEIHRARAQELAGTLSAPVVTARAVASLATLAEWCLPLVRAPGALLAMKGASAATELARDRRALRRSGATAISVDAYGASLLEVPTTVVRVVVGAGIGGVVGGVIGTAKRSERPAPADRAQPP